SRSQQPNPASFADAVAPREILRHRNVPIPKDAEQPRHALPLRFGDLDHEPAARSKPHPHLLEQLEDDLEARLASDDRFLRLEPPHLGLERLPLFFRDVRRIRNDDVYSPAERGMEW